MPRSTPCTGSRGSVRPLVSIALLLRKSYLRADGAIDTGIEGTAPTALLGAVVVAGAPNCGTTPAGLIGRALGCALAGNGAWISARRELATTPPGTRRGAAMLNCVIPSSTPPYTPCESCSFLASMMVPPFTRITDRDRSFQSIGMVGYGLGEPAAAKLYQVSASCTSDSMRNFAKAAARATSRRWKTTLFRSAIKSKLRLNASAYLTSG
mmetsp:Transcript_38681/g.90902  ORF Transcript_38681/g.90902 Transcript_38681/m.90902 type:complete len:210 (+) Transcript_38681:1173-1802(+)